MLSGSRSRGNLTYELPRQPDLLELHALGGCGRGGDGQTRWVTTARHVTFQRRPTIRHRVGNEPVLYRVVMNVIEMSGKILGITDDVVPESGLPRLAKSLRIAFEATCKPQLHGLHDSREILGFGRQDDPMEVVVEQHITEPAVRNGLLDFAHDREQQLLRLFLFQNQPTFETNDRN